MPEHFLLITRAFEPQTHLLRAEDLAATHACLRAYHDHDHGEELFAFFNSGEHSGASQPHRHVQLLPVARMRDGLLLPEEEDAARDGDGGGKAGWSVLADRLVGGADEEGEEAPPQLPFAVFSERLRPDMTGAALRAVYLRLYERACAAVAGVSAVVVQQQQQQQQEGEGEARISYNMAMTRGAMVLCPRTAEGDIVRDGRTGAEVGRLALNGTVLAGTALVKSRAEWDALRERGDEGDGKGGGDQLWRILGRIGVPPPAAAAGGRSAVL